MVKVFAASTKSLSYGCFCDTNFELLNTQHCDPVSIFKLARYIFPSQDPSPTEAGQTEISDLKCFEYLVHIAGHKLNWDL